MAQTKQDNEARKHPMIPHLFVGERGTVDDVRVASGYLVWNLIAVWIMGGEDDRTPIAEYNISEAEWLAAKEYYSAHQPILDARIITNSQLAAAEEVPPMGTVAEYFAWLRLTAQSRGVVLSAK